MAAELPVRTLLLLDSRSPAGAQHHSGGMEAAVRAGHVRTVADVAEFCRGRLRTAGRVAAGFAAAAARAWDDGATAAQWQRLDAELGARLPSPAARHASRALGSGLRRLLIHTEPAHVEALAIAWAGCPPPAPHHPIVLGVGVALTGGRPALAARAAALATCGAPASAAVRLLGLDPYAIHAVVAALAAEIESTAAEVAAGTELPEDCAPAMELLADHHLTSRERLFAS